jgi:methyl coenzyme M reductase subunit C
MVRGTFLKALRSEAVAMAMKEQSRRITKLSELSLVAGRSTSGAIQMASTQSTQKTATATRQNLTMFGLDVGKLR